MELACKSVGGKMAHGHSCGAGCDHGQVPGLVVVVVRSVVVVGEGIGVWW